MIKKNLLKFIPILSLAILIPSVAFAEFVGPCPTGTYNDGTGCVSSSGLVDVVHKIQSILTALLPLLISIGVVIFIWGIIMYVIADSDEAKTKGRDRIIFGIIGLAVIVGLWGLVTILTDTFFAGGSNLGAPSSISGLVTTTPADSTSACPTPSVGAKLQNYLDYITCIIGNSVIPLLFAVAVVVFIWGAMQFFIFNADEEAKRTQGRSFMIWGIIALAVMISIWGLVHILGSTFGIQGGSYLPQVRPN